MHSSFVGSSCQIEPSALCDSNEYISNMMRSDIGRYMCSLMHICKMHGVVFCVVFLYTTLFVFPLFNFRKLDFMSFYDIGTRISNMA